MIFPALFDRIQIKIESIGLEVMKMLSISESSEFFSHFPAQLTEEVFLIRSQFLFNPTVQLELMDNPHMLFQTSLPIHLKIHGS